MAVCYDRLFHLMIDKKMSNAQLKEKAGFSANIITRLKRNEYVSVESIERICRVLDCGVDDILEFIPEESKNINSKLCRSYRQNSAFESWKKAKASVGVWK